MHLVKNINLCCRTCWLYRLHLLFYFLGILSEKVVFYLDQSKTPFFIYGIIQFGPKRGLVPVPYPNMLCAKFGWNWPSGSEEESFLISSMYYRYFATTPFGKGHGPSFEQIWIPYTQGCFVPSLVEIGQMVLENMKMGKVYRRTTGNQKSSLSLKLRWAKLVMPFFFNQRYGIIKAKLCTCIS